MTLSKFLNSFVGVGTFVIKFMGTEFYGSKEEVLDQLKGYTPSRLDVVRFELVDGLGVFNEIHVLVERTRRLR